MPAVTRVGDNNTGHDACPPTALASGSPNVNVNGIPVGRVGDPYNPHGCPAHVPHVGNIASGAPHVFINGKAAGRIGDPVTCGGSVAVGSSNVFVGNGGGGSLKVKISTSEEEEEEVVATEDFKYKCTKDVVECSPLCNETDEIILSLPDISMAESSSDDKDEADREGWSYLSHLFKKWLTSDLYILKESDVEDGLAPVVTWELDWPWYLGYPRTSLKYYHLVNNVLTPAGKELLIKRLQSESRFYLGDSYSFDFSLKPVNQWEQWYINSVEVPREYEFGADGINAVFAAHMIKALPAGSVSFNSDGTKTITVNKIYCYIQDRFNFSGWDNYLWWSKKNLDFSNMPGESYYNLVNSDFFEFRKKFYKGGDFVLQSNLREYQEFQPVSFDVE